MKNLLLKRAQRALVLTISLGLSLSAWSQRITVTNPLDIGAGSIREAVTNANPGDTIDFDPVLTAMPILLTNGVIDIDKALVFEGNGIGATTISGDGLSTQLFNIVDADSVHFIGMSFTEGEAAISGGAISGINTNITLKSVDINNSVAMGPAALNGGGAVYMRNGFLRIGMNSIFTDNQASGMSGSGGAILLDSGATVGVMNTTFQGNIASRAGGAIESNNSLDTLSINISDATFTQNETGSAPGNGGAIHITGPASAFISTSTFSENVAANEGGALWNGAGTMDVVDCVIEDNEAQGIMATQGGGGLFNLAGTLNINDSEILNNHADSGSASGGGILNNVNATLNVTNTIISNNTTRRAGGAIEDNSVDGPSMITLTDVTMENNFVDSFPGNGGAVHISGPGNIDITGGIIRGNTASREGGGVWNGAGVMNITGTLIENNTVRGTALNQGGGGVFNQGGTINIVDANILNNHADSGSASGGGILNSPGTVLNVTNTTISGNTSKRAGGAIEDNAGGGVTLTGVIMENNFTGPMPGNGGAVHITGAGNIDVTGGIIRNNVAVREGGGLWNGAGVMNVTGTLIEGNSVQGTDAAQGGGGVLNQGGTVNISDAIIRNNHADSGSASGGGILNGPGNILTVTNTSISGNTSKRAGGAIEDNAGGGVTLTDVIMEDNFTGPVPGNGGAVHITGAGNIDITGGIIRNNEAAREGGGLWNGAGVMNVTGTQIEGNTVRGTAPNQGGGGVFNQMGTINIVDASILNNHADSGSASGGGILNSPGTVLNVTNTTISGNTSKRAGGAIEDNAGGGVVLTNVTMENNITGPMPGNGGAVHITGAGNMEINGGVARNNVAANEGGGLWNGSGTMTVTDMNIEDNRADGRLATQGGGGLFNQTGTLIVSNSIINRNSADSALGSGGGILNGTGAILTVSNTSISNNSANRAGAGIEDFSGNESLITLDEVTFTNNTTGPNPGNGGAIHITGNGNINITGGSASNNEARSEGGAFWNGAGIMNIDGTEITNNAAFGTDPDQGGGGIYNLSGTVNISNARIAKNTATNGSGSGGGILNDAGATLNVSNTSIRSNIANRAGGGIEDVSGPTTMLMLNNINLDSNVVNNSPGNGGGLHITGAGSVTIADGTVNGNKAGAEGGGLWNGLGTMTISGTAFNGNQAFGKMANQGGGAIYVLNTGTVIVDDAVFNLNSADSVLGSGGAILVDSAATLTVSNSIFEGNSAQRAGGAIEDVSGSATIMFLNNNRFSGNTTGPMPGNGGAIHITGPGNANIVDSEFTNNEAFAEGGALWNGSGLMNVDSCSFNGNIASGPGADQGGGAIYNLLGVLSVNESSFSNNDADGAAGSGGAILNDANATLNVSNAIFSANKASRAGGAIEDNSGASSNVMIDNVSFLDNETGPAPGNGGAIHITGPGNMSINDVEARGNVASNEGGAFWNGSGLMTISNALMDDNEAQGPAITDGGGSVFNNGGTIELSNSSISNSSATGAEGTGGGVHNLNGIMTITNVTISGNSADAGGGFFNRGKASVLNSTIVLNDANALGGGIFQNDASDSLSIKGSLVAVNTADMARDVSSSAGMLVSGNFNLIGADNGNFPAQDNDLVGTAAAPINPNLELLRDNGGTTLTHSFLDASPALNANDPADNSLDQVGQAVFGGRKDIGAFECQTCSAVGINNGNAADAMATVYPNPSFGSELNVRAENGQKMAVVLLDNSGKILMAKTAEGLVQLNTKNISAGSYILQVEVDGLVESTQIIKL